MKKNELKSFLLSLEDKELGKLVGGFSKVFESNNANGISLAKNKDCITTNNCNGANCRQGCGAKD